MTEDSSRELIAISALLKQVVGQMRQRACEQIVATTVNLVREMGLHLSDYLKALATYVETQSSLDPDTEETRAIVSSLLQTAASDAEAKGRELP